MSVFNSWRRIDKLLAKIYIFFSEYVILQINVFIYFYLE